MRPPDRFSQALKRCTAADVLSGENAYPSSGISSSESMIRLNPITLSTTPVFDRSCLAMSFSPAR